jgi:7SK snRNA methylphosphate capping enzyme
MPRSVRLAVEAKPVFPQNLSFMVQDVMMLGRGIAKSDSLESGHSPSTYGSIFCLSLTKWIHLNYGDEGLLRFFRILHRLLDPDGYLILEFQSWQSYINNKNTSSITKQVFKSIQIKPEQFESELVRLGFEVVQRLGTPVEVARGFNRPILVLQRTGSGSCAADTHAAAEATDESNAKDERDAGEKGSTERVCDQVEVERGDDADVCVDISTGIGEEEGAESPRKRKRKSKKDRKHKKDRQERE